MGDPPLILEAGSDLNEALAQAADHAVITLAPGTYPAVLRLTRSVTIQGTGDPTQVILDADERGRVVTVEAKEIEVTFQGVTLKGGRAEAGGALSLRGRSRVSLRDCILTENQGYRIGGGAIYASIGRLDLERCRVADNEAPGGTAIRADQVVHLSIRDSLVVGSVDRSHGLVMLLDAADVTVERSTLVAEGGPAVSLAGTRSRHPTLAVSGSILSGSPPLANDRMLPGDAAIGRSVLPSPPQGVFADQGDNRFGDPDFVGEGDEPYRPAPHSPAAGLAAGGGLDLIRAERPVDSATAGAIEV